MSKSDLRGGRKAYQCLRCLQKKGRIMVEASCRVYSHFLRDHLALDDLPFYCKLCLFRAFTQKELDQHVTTYRRHKLLAAENNIIDSTPYLVTNSNPYFITDKDIAPLTDTDTAKFWNSRRKSSAAASPLPKDMLQETVLATFGSEGIPLQKPQSPIHDWVQSTLTLPQEDFFTATRFPNPSPSPPAETEDLLQHLAPLPSQKDQEDLDNSSVKTPQVPVPPSPKSSSFSSSSSSSSSASCSASLQALTQKVEANTKVVQELSAIVGNLATLIMQSRTLAELSNKEKEQSSNTENKENLAKRHIEQYNPSSKNHQESKRDTNWNRTVSVKRRRESSGDRKYQRSRYYR